MAFNFLRNVLGSEKKEEEAIAVRKELLPADYVVNWLNSVFKDSIKQSIVEDLRETLTNKIANTVDKAIVSPNDSRSYYYSSSDEYSRAILRGFDA